MPSPIQYLQLGLWKLAKQTAVLTGMPSSVVNTFWQGENNKKKEMADYGKKEIESGTLDKQLAAELESTQQRGEAKVKSYVDTTKIMTEKQIASDQEVASVRLQTDDAKIQQSSAEQKAGLLSQRAAHLDGAVKAQESAAKDQLKGNQSEAKVDQIRINMARVGEDAAIAHLAAVKEAQLHERKGFGVTMQTAVAEVRQGFALQITEKLASMDKQLMAYENKLHNQTADNRLKLGKQIAGIKADKVQYLDGLKAKLTADEMGHLSGLMAGKMTADSFSRREEAKISPAFQEEHAAATKLGLNSNPQQGLVQPPRWIVQGTEVVLERKEQKQSQNEQQVGFKV